MKKTKILSKVLSGLAVCVLAVVGIFAFNGCKPKTYKLDFMVDGAVYKTIKTKGNEEITLPENPTVAEYLNFDGWYLDETTQDATTEFKADTLKTNPIKKDTKVYAKTSQKAQTIVIGTYEEFKTFINDVRTNIKADIDCANGVYFSADINCNNEVLAPIISSDLIGVDFVINGLGHKITNFKVNQTTTVGSAAGSSSNGFTVLSLFPKFEGGELKNIEFKDFTLETAGVDMTALNLQVGLVGYARSNGNGEGTAADSFKNATFENVKLTNQTVNVQTALSTRDNNYGFAIGSLIGFDSTQTIAGTSFTQAAAAMRKNITVSNFVVNVDKVAGEVNLGGIAGQMHWENVKYENCTVDAKFNVINRNTGAEVREDTINLGGIIGADYKSNYGIEVVGCTANVTGNFAKAGTTNVRSGKVVGYLATTPNPEETSKMLVLTESNNILNVSYKTIATTEFDATSPEAVAEAFNNATAVTVEVNYHGEVKDQNPVA